MNHTWVRPWLATVAGIVCLLAAGNAYGSWETFAACLAAAYFAFSLTLAYIQIIGRDSALAHIATEIERRHHADACAPHEHDHTLCIRHQVADFVAHLEPLREAAAGQVSLNELDGIPPDGASAMAASFYTAGLSWLSQGGDSHADQL